jgi:hypothetical protein
MNYKIDLLNKVYRSGRTGDKLIRLMEGLSLKGIKGEIKDEQSLLSLFLCHLWIQTYGLVM